MRRHIGFLDTPSHNPAITKRQPLPCAARDVHLIYLPVDMKWDAYRTDRRYGDLLVRCGFASSP
jgi:hypothetical protein